jgi:hypothetical protein
MRGPLPSICTYEDYLEMLVAKDAFMRHHRPPPHFRPELDLGFRVYVDVSSRSRRRFAAPRR